MLLFLGKRLNSHPKFGSTIVYGTKKFQSTLLIEPINPERSKDSLLDELWPNIKTANISCPAHARIMSKDFVAFTKPDKPFPRAGKGTVQRRQAEKLYETELNSLYETNANGQGTNNNTSGNSSVNKFASSDLQGTIIRTISNLQGFETFSPSDNFFEHGLDSLGVISLTRAVNLAFESQDPPRDSIRESMIYAYPSPEKLACALSNSAKDENENYGEMQEEYESFVSDLPIIPRPSTPFTGPKVFLLTGSTGSLGSYILSNLLIEDETCKVYCLNRGEDIEKRQLNSSSSKGLSTDFSRVCFLSMATGATEAWLGIKLDQYKELLNEVTHIIHNAWHVDFNLSFSQMGATHIRRVRQLIDFSAHSRFGASIHFISSISTVGNWYDNRSNSPSSSGYSTPSQSESEPSIQPRVLEIPYEDWLLPQGLGYGQSKFVAERLITTACKVSNIPASIYRVGQIAGPKSSEGKWNEQKWFPLIVKSSTYLKALPSSLGPLEAVDWIPVDLLGKVVYELVTSSDHDTLESDSTSEFSSESPKIFHLVNPKRTTYSDAVLPRLQSILDLPTKPFEEWVQRLHDSAANTQDVKIHDDPTVKILGFYEGLVEKKKEGRSQV
ncbi:hypothetical protein BTUL_0030g00620 [Botrytis tulipae]|uniref:Carrier domain-containing protein n=1 Tax=Botrytis tulipae TaxID=87230 RepID=A0A4Z1EVI9_9HELO|nr:hypothetical protein BTUL_0030g00620 [Botrytis tulipae]